MKLNRVSKLGEHKLACLIPTYHRLPPGITLSLSATDIGNYRYITNGARLTTVSACTWCLQTSVTADDCT